MLSEMEKRSDKSGLPKRSDNLAAMPQPFPSLPFPSTAHHHSHCINATVLGYDKIVKILYHMLDIYVLQVFPRTAIPPG